MEYVQSIIIAKDPAPKLCEIGSSKKKEVDKPSSLRTGLVHILIMQ